MADVTELAGQPLEDPESSPVTQLTAPLTVEVTPDRGELEEPAAPAELTVEVTPSTTPLTVPTTPATVLPTTGSWEATWVTVFRAWPPGFADNAGGMLGAGSPTGAWLPISFTGPLLPAPERRTLPDVAAGAPPTGGVYTPPAGAPVCGNTPCPIPCVVAADRAPTAERAALESPSSPVSLSGEESLESG